MKTNLLIFFLTLSCVVNAQWQMIRTFHNTVYSFITCDNNLYAGLGGGGVYTSKDSGVSWTAVNNGIQFGGAYIFSLTSRNDSIYAGGFGEVCFTRDAGKYWSLLDLNLSLNSNVNALMVKDSYLFAGVGHDKSNGVYRKQLSGTKWIQVNNGLPENVGVNAFAVINNTLFAGTDSGIYKSVDNGVNWIVSSNGISSETSIMSLYPINGNLLAGTRNGILVSSDNGSTWNSSTGIPLNTGVSGFASNNGMVVAGTWQGAFSSLDNGLTWSNLNNESLNSTGISSITSLGNYFYAGTGSGIFTTNLSIPPLVSENSINIGERWSVYPNPFSSQMTIQAGYYLENATLTIYNLQGQVVKQMDKLCGQTIIFHRDHLSSGQYFIRLMQENKVIGLDKLIITDN